MNKINEISKFEFILTLENNIICQRYFNVKDYNPESKNSIDLYDTVKNICDDISNELVTKTVEYMSTNHNYYDNTVIEENESTIENEMFLIEIKLEDELFITRGIEAKYYHPKVRYSVDIRPNLRRYLSELATTLSSNELETKYLQYEL